MSIYSNLEGIRKLSNSSLTSIVDVTNLNFTSLSDAVLGYLNNISYDEDTNSFTAVSGSFTHVDIADTLSLKLDGIPTFTINAQGKAEGQELLVVVSESKRHRFTDFNDWPSIGVPGEVVYTGVQNQQPQFGEDFIGYLEGRGWVSLTALTTPIQGLNLLPEAGSPLVVPSVPNGQGLIWIGPLGNETTYEPENTTVYFTDDDGNTFDILQDFAWEIVGTNAVFKPTGKAIIDNGAQFQYVDGNETAGFILTSDGSGNAYWAANVGGGGGGPLNYSYWEINSFVADVTQTITHNLQTLNVVVDFIDTITNERVNAHVDNYTSNTLDITLNSTNPSVKIVIVSAGGILATTVPHMSPDDRFLPAETTIADEDIATLSTLSNTPINGCYVEVKVNGIEYEVGDGVKTKSCYFSGNGGTDARGFLSTHPNGQVQSGDELYWNGSIAGFELVNGAYRISLNYIMI
jgi:hypothetical protein